MPDNRGPGGIPRSVAKGATLPSECLRVRQRKIYEPPRTPWVGTSQTLGSTPITGCEVCSSLVRRDRLQKHIWRVHLKHDRSNVASRVRKP
jgi:hypothetical protein